MKILLTLCFILASQVSFAADPVAPGAPAVKDVSAPGEPPAGGKDKTLLAKPGKNPCRSDVEKFCKGIKPGAGAVMACLKEHQDKLSPACKVQGETMKKNFMAHGQQIQDACHVEIEKFCKGTKGPRELFSCLGDHGKEVSPECKAALPPAAPGRK